MNISLFESVTTEAALLEIEAEAKKYDGLYVEMDDAKQRKYVKDKASFINGLLKSVDRSRIDMTKAYKLNVDNQADNIKGRLQAANEPFTALIDKYNAERKVILDAEKAKKAQDELYIQIGIDHEFALLLDKSHAADKAEAERVRLAEAEALAARIISDNEEIVERERLDRLADIENVQSVNRSILLSLMQLYISEEDAKRAIAMIAKGQIQHLTINY